MKALQITVSSTDDSDVEWLQSRCVAVVENEVEERSEHMDGDVVVDWEYVDLPD